jgi:transposase InsO family protein
MSEGETRGEFRAPMGEVVEPTRPFQSVHVDFVSPYPLTENKIRYIMTSVDHLTKYVEAVPVTDMSAETCARAYATQIVARHGVNESIVTDQGRSSTSSLFNETCKILGVKHLTTSAYQPQSNGIAERYHRTMKAALTCYVNAAGTNWDRLLPFYVMAYNGSPHSASGFTPYYLLFGR